MSHDWQLYIIRCGGGELYTGVTTDVVRRFGEHNSGGPKAAKYLRGRGPLTLVYRELAGGRGDALRRELAIKKLTKAAKEALIASKTNLLTAPPATTKATAASIDEMMDKAVDAIEEVIADVVLGVKDDADIETMEN